MAKKLPHRARNHSPNSVPRGRSKLASRLAHRPVTHRRTSRRRLFGPKNMNHLITSISPRSTNNIRNHYNTPGTNVYSRVDPCGQPIDGAPLSVSRFPKLESN